MIGMELVWRELLPSDIEKTFEAKSLSCRLERNVDADGVWSLRWLASASRKVDIVFDALKVYV